MVKFIVLGGGADQIALIKEIREQVSNSYIVLVDYLANPIAKPFADEHIQESSLDIKMVKYLAESKKVDYVITACTDQALLTMAYVSEALSLPCYITYNQALELTNKLYMKHKMLDNGIPTSKYVCLSENYNVQVLKDLTFPLVVKPVDSNSSKGVRKVNTVENLKDAVKDAFSYSLTKNVIVEEFKEGNEISVDLYIEGKCAKMLSLTESKKVKQNKDNFTIVQSIYPCSIDINEKRILEIAQQIVDSFGLKDCPLLIQMIVHENCYNVIEFSARMGGGSKYNLINVLSGIDIMKVYVEMFLGKLPRIVPKKMLKIVTMNYIYCNKGEYNKIENIKYLQEEGIISNFFIYKTARSVFEKSINSSDRVAGFLIIANDKKEASMKLEKANSILKVIDVNGIDIMRHDMLKSC